MNITDNSSVAKPRIMIFCDSYLPGYKGGGGMWAVFNLADRLKDVFDFFIVTRDCDGKLDRTPFVRAARDKWNDRPEAKVYYASPATLNRKSFESLVKEIGPDLIYSNSVFSYVCVKFLLTRRKARLTNIPVVTAPCGEFASAALNIKSAKKRSFLAFARMANLFDGVIWKASADDEREDILRTVGSDVRVELVPELAPRELLPDFGFDQKPKKVSGEVRLIYFSRITPKKNLMFVLEMLSECSAGKVDLDIVGPTDNDEYLQKCREAADRLPPNITVNFVGGKRFEDGLSALVDSHFMVFPTLNENFGYVLIESLAAGSPVIASNQIIWKDADQAQFLTRIPLDRKDTWLETIGEAIELNADDYQRLSLAARDFAVKWLATDDSVNIFRTMLKRVIEGSK